MVETRQVEPQLQALFTGLSMVGRGEGLMTGGWPAASQKKLKIKKDQLRSYFLTPLLEFCVCAEWLFLLYFVIIKNFFI